MTILARSLYDILLISGDARTLVESPDQADAIISAEFSPELDFTDEDGGCCQAPIVKLPAELPFFDADSFDNWSSFGTEFVEPFAYDDLALDEVFCFWLECDVLVGCRGFILGNCCSNFLSVSLIRASISDWAYFVASADPLNMRTATSVMLQCPLMQTRLKSQHQD